MITKEERVKELENARQMVREWQATVEILEDPETVRQLNEAEAEMAAGIAPTPAEDLREAMLKRMAAEMGIPGVIE